MIWLRIIYQKFRTMKNHLAMFLSDGEQSDSLNALTKKSSCFSSNYKISDFGSEFVRSGFVALQSHMESCIRSGNLASNLKIFFSQIFDFFEFRLVSFACVLSITTFFVYKISSYF